MRHHSKQPLDSPRAMRQSSPMATSVRRLSKPPILSTPRRLALAALIFMLPIVVLSVFMELNFRHDVNIARSELAGTDAIRETLKTLGITQRLLTLHGRAKRGDTEATREIPPLQMEVQHHIDQLENKLSAPIFTSFRNSSGCPATTGIRSAWQNYIHNSPDGLDSVIKELLALFEKAANCSRLNLDPALDSAMLAWATIPTLPHNTAFAGKVEYLAHRAMAGGKVSLSRSLLDESLLLRTARTQDLQRRSRAAIEADPLYYGKSASLRGIYAEQLAEYQRQVELLTFELERWQQGDPVWDTLARQAREVRRGSVQLLSRAMDEMDRLIQKRIESYQRWRFAGAGLSALATLFALAFLARTARGITMGIRHAVDYTHRVAGGDYDAQPDYSPMGPGMRRLTSDAVKMVTELKHKIGHLNGILEAISVPCLAVDTDERLTYVNRAYLDLYEREGDPDDYFGMHLAEFFYGDPAKSTIAGRAMVEDRPFQNLHLDTVSARGNRVFVRYDVSPLHALDGETIGAFAVVVDLTEIREQQQEISRLAAFPRESPEPVISVGPEAEVVYANPTAQDLTREIGGDINRLLPENHRDMVARCIRTGENRIGVESTAGDRILSWTYHPLPEQNTVHIYASDITQRKQAEDQLLHDAFHDSLTGLPNKALFIDRVGQTMRRARKNGQPFAVLFLDVDNFKAVNDSLGHAAGDSMLMAFAWRVGQIIRPEDTLARLGGDEFTLLLPTLQSAEESLSIAEEIRDALTDPFDVDGQEIFLTASIGIVTGPGSFSSAGELLRDAETAMYRAKARGRARSVVFDEDMHRDASERLKLETDLTKAVENGEFVPYYQPIIDLRSGRVHGFEALIRWEHPTDGLVPPGAFIPLAEETGLIVPMGEFMLEASARQLRIWQERYPAFNNLSMSVNLSVEQMKTEGIVTRLSDIIDRSGIRPELIKIEVTESGIMENMDYALAVLKEFENRAFHLSIDDFGTGYSSLSHLHRFPFHFLKIDQSFVGDMEQKRENMEIVRTIVSLAHSLGKSVIAEGVEEESQLNVLKALGCEYGQGYYFSKPLPHAEAEALLSEAPVWK